MNCLLFAKWPGYFFSPFEKWDTLIFFTPSPFFPFFSAFIIMAVSEKLELLGFLKKLSRKELKTRTERAENWVNQDCTRETYCSG